MLIDTKCDVNLQDDNRRTALMYASGNSNNCSTEKTVQALIDANCDVNMQDNSRRTELMLVSRYPDIQIFNSLFNRKNSSNVD